MVGLTTGQADHRPGRWEAAWPVSGVQGHRQMGTRTLMRAITRTQVGCMAGESGL